MGLDPPPVAVLGRRHRVDHGALARFESRDHLGSPERTLRENVEAFLGAHGVTLGDGARPGTILMAAQPRSLGYAFNPISVFWCFDDHGRQDHEHAQELYRLLEEEVVPAFYERDERGLPAAWLERVRASMKTCGPLFSASRMVRDYEEKLYGARV